MRGCNVGYFEGRQHTKKWLATRQDLDAMYSYFQGKMCISLWCDGREADATDEEMLVHPSKQGAREKRKKDHEEELEEIFEREAWFNIFWTTAAPLGTDDCS